MAEAARNLHGRDIDANGVEIKDLSKVVLSPELTLKIYNIINGEEEA